MENKSDLEPKEVQDAAAGFEKWDKQHGGFYNKDSAESAYHAGRKASARELAALNTRMKVAGAAMGAIQITMKSDEGIIAALTAHLEAKEAECEALRRDAERVDWLEKARPNIYFKVGHVYKNTQAIEIEWSNKHSFNLYGWRNLTCRYRRREGQP